MVSIDDLLEPGRALETLVRRAARGQRQALRLLLQHAPRAIEAEGRWLYPALLHRRPGGANRAQLLPFTGEHEQMIELLEDLAERPGSRFDATFRAIEWMAVRHVRAERAWLRGAIAAHVPRDDPAFARYLAQCRPLLEAAATLSALEAPARADAR